MTMFTKDGCHLCEELRDQLQVMQQELQFTIVERDIERSLEEFERFRALVPVLDIPGIGMIYPPHDACALRHAIATAVDGDRASHA